MDGLKTFFFANVNQYKQKNNISFNVNNEEHWCGQQTEEYRRGGRLVSEAMTHWMHPSLVEGCADSLQGILLPSLLFSSIYQQTYTLIEERRNLVPISSYHHGHLYHHFILGIYTRCARLYVSQFNQTAIIF